MNGTAKSPHVSAFQLIADGTERAGDASRLFDEYIIVDDTAVLNGPDGALNALMKSCGAEEVSVTTTAEGTVVRVYAERRRDTDYDYTTPATNTIDHPIVAA